MNKSNQLVRFMPWLSALLLSVVVAGCGGGGSEGRDPILGAKVAASTTLMVASTSPITAAVGVCPTATIGATFTVPSGLKIDPATVNSTTFIVTGPGPAFTPVVASSITVDAATGLTATFSPSAALTTGTVYTATVKGGAAGVKDLAIPGNAMAADYVWSFTAGAAGGNCQAPAALATASNFGAFGGSAGVTNQGILTQINNGNLGTTAASTLVTGFHDSPVCVYTETTLNKGAVSGKIFTDAPPPGPSCLTEGTAATFATAQQGLADAQNAYNALVAAPAGPKPGAGNLANLTLTPGVYTSSTSFAITGGDLTLDAQGNANAVWIFQMGSTLTVGGPGSAFPQSVILKNGAQAKNVFWQVGSAATINAAGGGTMVGTIIAQQGVSFSTANNATVATLNGRALSLVASVTVVNTVINVP